MFVFVYLNHIGRAEPEFSCDNPVIHQNISYPQSSRVFSSCNYIQESEKKRKKLMKLISYVVGVIHVCETECLCMSIF